MSKNVETVDPNQADTDETPQNEDAEEDFATGEDAEGEADWTEGKVPPTPDQEEEKAADIFEMMNSNNQASEDAAVADDTEREWQELFPEMANAEEDDQIPSMGGDQNQYVQESVIPEANIPVEGTQQALGGTKWPEMGNMGTYWLVSIFVLLAAYVFYRRLAKNKKQSDTKSSLIF